MKKKQKEFLPCPFCGKLPEIVVTDDEGNIRGIGAAPEYEADPWSGLAFALRHDVGIVCPVSTSAHEYYSLLYGSRDDAIEAWNIRTNTKKRK